MWITGRIPKIMFAYCNPSNYPKQHHYHSSNGTSQSIKSTKKQMQQTIHPTKQYSSFFSGIFLVRYTEHTRQTEFTLQKLLLTSALCSHGSNNPDPTHVHYVTGGDDVVATSSQSLWTTPNVNNVNLVNDTGC